MENAQDRNRMLKSWLLLFVLSLIWGSSFILIKKSLLVFTPGELGAFRIVAAGVVLLPLSMPKVGKLTFRQLKYLFVVGLVGSFIPAFLFAQAQTGLPSSLTGALNALTPLMVALIGAAVFQARMTRKNSLGLLIAFMGVAMLVLYSGHDGWEALSGVNYHAFFVLAAAICYGFNVNIIKFKFTELDPVVITAVSLMTVLPLAAVYLFAFTHFSYKVLHVDGALAATAYVGLLGTMGTALALIIFNMLVKLVSPVFASSVTYFVPIIAIFWGVLDGETLLPWHYLGIAGVILGVWIGNRR